MTMISENNPDGFNTDYKRDRDPFLEHVERMLGFRRSHGDIEMVNGPRFDAPDLLESMLPLKVNRIMSLVETGGSRTPDNMMDWSILVPILKVVRYKLSQN